MLGKGMGKKYICLLTATVMMLLVALTGCSSDTNKDVGSTPTDPAKTATSTAAPTEPPEELKEPGEINILTVDSVVNNKNHPDKEVFKIIEEKLNIKIKWQTLPNAGYEDALNH